MLFTTLCIAKLRNRKYDIIPLLTDVAQAAVKEKVIRVIVATFRVRYPMYRYMLYLNVFLESCHESTITKPAFDASSSAPAFCKELVWTEMDRRRHCRRRPIPSRRAEGKFRQSNVRSIFISHIQCL